MSTIKSSETLIPGPVAVGTFQKKALDLLREKTPEVLLEAINVLDQRNKELESQIIYLQNIKNASEKSELEFSDLFDYAPNGYFILNRSGEIKNVNKEGCRQLGIEKRQLIGNSLSVFVNTKEQQEEFQLHKKRVLDNSTLQHCDVEIKRKDGSVFNARLECVMINDENGKFKNINCMLFDISDKIEQSKKMELALGKEKELNELKSRFISMASHEFRTPLASILSSVYLLEKYNEMETGEKRLNHINKIRNSVIGLNEILMDFLSLSQIEKGKIQLNPETFNLLRFIEDLIEEARIAAAEHAIEFIHKGEKQDVYLDKKLLKICITNLIGNAIKYSPYGKTIRISSEFSNDKELLCISVQDKGIGIPENDQPHIFEQFFRAKNADAFQGTGLGLNIIRKLVAMMKGEISFTSEINKGSEFSLKFREY